MGGYFFFSPFFSEIGQCNHNSEGWTVGVKGKSIELSICRKPGQRDFSPLFFSSNLFFSFFWSKHYVCHFVKLQMAFVHALLCIHFCGQGRSLFITSWGPGVFCKEASAEGNRRGARQLSVGVLRFCCHLILFFFFLVPAPFQKNLSWGEERRCQLFFLNPVFPPFLLLLPLLPPRPPPTTTLRSKPKKKQKKKRKSPVWKHFNQKTRVSDM